MSTPVNTSPQIAKCITIYMAAGSQDRHDDFGPGSPILTVEACRVHFTLAVHEKLRQYQHDCREHTLLSSWEQGMQKAKAGVKDYAYHKEKMMMCKQAEQGVPLQAMDLDMESLSLPHWGKICLQDQKYHMGSHTNEAFDIFGCICYITKDGENLDKMKEKGDPCVMVGYSTQSKGYSHVYNNENTPVPQCSKDRFDRSRSKPRSSLAMTSDHKRSELGIQGPTAMNTSSSKLVQSCSSSRSRLLTSRQEFGITFHLHIAMLETTGKLVSFVQRRIHKLSIDISLRDFCIFNRRQYAPASDTKTKNPNRGLDAKRFKQNLVRDTFHFKHLLTSSEFHKLLSRVLRNIIVIFARNI
ncbi:hypothetical protein Tco_0598321 [Tanacetum coccineum]